MSPALVALIAWAAAIAVCDLAGRRVPNLALVGALMMVGASFALRGVGPLGLDPVTSLLGAAVPLALLPAYAAGNLGAGDVKLAATMGLVLGPAPIALALVLAGLLLGGAASYRLIRQRPHPPRIAAAPMLAGAFTMVLTAAALH